MGTGDLSVRKKKSNRQYLFEKNNYIFIVNYKYFFVNFKVMHYFTSYLKKVI